MSGPTLSLWGIFPASGLEEVVQAALLIGFRDCSRRCHWPRDLLLWHWRPPKALQPCSRPSPARWSLSHPHLTFSGPQRNGTASLAFSGACQIYPSSQYSSWGSRPESYLRLRACCAGGALGSLRHTDRSPEEVRVGAPSGGRIKTVWETCLGWSDLCDQKHTPEKRTWEHEEQGLCMQTVVCSVTGEATEEVLASTINGLGYRSKLMYTYSSLLRSIWGSE